MSSNHILGNPVNAVTPALVCVLMWSTVASGFKLGLSSFAIEQLLLLGTVVSWLVFFGYAAATKQLALAAPDRKLAVSLGLINPTAYYLILFAAYDRLPAHVAQPINYTWAITLALLAVPILGQRLSLRSLGGILVSYLGVVILVTTTPAEAGTISSVGVALALFSTVLWAGYWLLNTRSRAAPASLMFWSFSVALPVIVVICWLGPGFPSLSVQSLGFAVWIGAIEMGVTFLLWQRALRLAHSSAKIAQLIFISPFLSLLLIHLLLDEPISFWAIPALAVIVAGLVMSQNDQPAV
ncbi:MAG: EamA family transporter [Proteobacteria bacterium]|nr:EamA family transporter [Pseudomonadota bacterium]